MTFDGKSLNSWYAIAVCPCQVENQRSGTGQCKLLYLHSLVVVPDKTSTLGKTFTEIQILKWVILEVDVSKVVGELRINTTPS